VSVTFQHKLISFSVNYFLEFKGFWAQLNASLLLQQSSDSPPFPENLEDPTQHVWLSLLAKQKLNQHLCWLVGIHATDPNTGSSNACWDGEQGQDCVRQYSSDL